MEQQLLLLSKSDLENCAKENNIPYENLSKKKLVKTIIQYYYDLEKYENFEYIEQLGHAGKDAQTFSAYDKKRNIVAVKIFKNKISPKKIAQEAQLQMICAKHSISPKVIEYSGTGKYIAMEKMDKTLYQVIIEQNGILTLSQQKQLANIFKTLDKCKVFHADPNPLNFMCKNGKWYIIDFGFAKKIDSKIIKENGKTPNQTMMPIGLVLQLRLLFPDCRLEFFEGLL